jgi:hypothetical protein
LLQRLDGPVGSILMPTEIRVGVRRMALVSSMSEQCKPRYFITKLSYGLFTSHFIDVSDNDADIFGDRSPAIS